ncbi:HpcH/HpaI aldolase/citrate lyase family protein [Cupriavidus necator]
MTPNTYLFVPANRPERFEKAVASGADVVIFDLEDAVANENKVGARSNLRSYMENGGRGHVRINGVGTREFEEDLVLGRLPGVDGIVLPKAEDADVLRYVAKAIRADKPILPLIETAKGIANVQSIACAQGVSRLVFGTVDFCLDLGIDEEENELLVHRSNIVLASRLANILPPVDGVTISVNDADVLRKQADRARRLGFGAKLCIHPTQVSHIAACFRPSAEVVDWAQRVLKHMEQHGTAGAFSIDGKMVDAPVVELAKRLIGRIK